MCRWLSMAMPMRSGVASTSTLAASAGELRGLRLRSPEQAASREASPGWMEAGRLDWYEVVEALEAVRDAGRRAPPRPCGSCIDEPIACLGGYPYGPCCASRSRRWCAVHDRQSAVFGMVGMVAIMHTWRSKASLRRAANSLKLASDSSIPAKKSGRLMGCGCVDVSHERQPIGPLSLAHSLRTRTLEEIG